MFGITHDVMFREKTAYTDQLKQTKYMYFQKIASRLASAIACTLMSHMMAYVSRFIELLSTKCVHLFSEF